MHKVGQVEDKLTSSKEMTGSCQAKAKILAISSGKGGVGKTNIAANLALCMAARQKKVLLVDGDLSLGNLDIIMDVAAKHNISHVINGQKTIEDIIHISPEGIGIICGASGLEELANLNEFRRLRLLNELERLGSNNDIIIIDTAGGIFKSVVGFCLAADHTLVVATPEATAITDAYAMIKVLVRNKFSGKISLIVNMAKTFAEGRNTYQHISHVANRFMSTNVYDGGVFLRDERMTLAVNHKKPLVLAYPNAQITSSFAALAAKLIDTSANEISSEGFFRKVVDWFL